jgi:hypothetical protein
VRCQALFQLQFLGNAAGLSGRDEKRGYRVPGCRFQWRFGFSTGNNPTRLVNHPEMLLRAAVTNLAMHVADIVATAAVGTKTKESLALQGTALRPE